MVTQNRLPTGDGSNDTWAALGAGSKYVEVDDPIGTPDDDSTYIFKQDSAGKQTSTFVAFDISASSITKLITFSRHRVTAGGGVGLGHSIWVNGTVYNTTLATISSTSYADGTVDWLTNPNTSSPWTEADIEGVGANPLEEFGVRAFNITAGKEIRATQTYATVDYVESGADFTKTLTDGIDLSEIFSKSLSLNRIFSDGIDLSESFLRQYTALKNLSDKIVLSEEFSTVLVAAGIIDIALSDGLILSELNARSLEIDRKFSDKLILSELNVRSLEINRKFSDKVQLSKLFSEALNFNRNLSDEVQLSESILKQFALTRNFSDGIAFSEIQKRFIDYSIGLNDGIDLSEEVDITTTLLGLTRTLSDTITLSELRISKSEYLKGLSDGLVLAELISASGAIGIGRSTVRGILQSDIVREILQSDIVREILRSGSIKNFE